MSSVFASLDYLLVNKIAKYDQNTTQLQTKPYTLVGPTVTRPVQDPLAVLSLQNQTIV